MSAPQQPPSPARGKGILPGSPGQTSLDFGPEIRSEYTTSVKYKASPSLTEGGVVPTADAFAEDYLRNGLKLAPEDYRVTGKHTSSGIKVTHIYLRQVVQGKDVFNGNINLNVGPAGQILSVGNSFSKAKVTPPQDVATSANVELEAVAKAVLAAMNQRKLTQAAPSLAVLKASIVNSTSASTSGAAGPKNSVQYQLAPSPPSSSITGLEVTDGYLQLKDRSLVPVWNIELDLANAAGVPTAMFNSKVAKRNNTVVASHSRVNHIGASSSD